MNFRKISLIGLIGLIAPAIAFAQNPEILLNRQGLAQHDLSIRGSSYSGAGISINGLNLTAPYSAHFNSELPLLDQLLSEPQAQTGLNNISGHLVGTAAYTLQPLEDQFRTSAEIGTKEHYRATLSGQQSGIGVFIDGEKARQIDYDVNDLDRYVGGANLQLIKNDWQLDLIAAHQKKEFGTQGYQGIGTGQQELEDNLLHFSATRGELDGSHFRAGAAVRQLDLNEADSRFSTAVIEGRTIEIQHIALKLRGDIEHEEVDGDIDDDRTRGSVLILPEARFERLTLKAGLNSVFQTAESIEWLPQAGIDYSVTDNTRLFTAYSENIRQPDYQTLADNPLLQQQRSQNTQLGFRQYLSASLDWRTAAFHRRMENATDWIGGTATDLGTLNVYGAEAKVDYYPSDKLDISLYYQWIHKDDDTSGGLYELDYPEHLLALSGHWTFLPELTLFTTQILRYQKDNPARTSSDFGAEASLGLHYLPRYAKNLRLSFLVDNLWGTNFQSIPGLKPRPTTVSTGIAVTW